MLLILNRLFELALEKEKYLLATIISCISFIISLWGLIYIIEEIMKKISWKILVIYHSKNKQKVYFRYFF
jgi:hypothetical protein